MSSPNTLVTSFNFSNDDDDDDDDDELLRDIPCSKKSPQSSSKGYTKERSRSPLHVQFPKNIQNKWTDLYIYLLKVIQKKGAADLYIHHPKNIKEKGADVHIHLPKNIRKK